MCVCVCACVRACVSVCAQEYLKQLQGIREQYHHDVRRMRKRAELEVCVLMHLFTCECALYREEDGIRHP